MKEGNVIGQGYDTRGGQPAFKVYNSGNVAMVDRTFQTYVPDIEVFDVGGYFDLGGTSRYTPLIAGIYYFYIHWSTTGNTLPKSLFSRIRKNGTTTLGGMEINDFGTIPNSNLTSAISCIASMDGVTDYITFETRADHIGGTTNQSIGNGPGDSHCGGYLIA